MVDGVLAEHLMQVQILSPLLASERFELACNAIGQALRTCLAHVDHQSLVTLAGLVEFQPGERVLHQGLMRSAKLWQFFCTGAFFYVYRVLSFARQCWH